MFLSIFFEKAGSNCRLRAQRWHHSAQGFDTEIIYGLFSLTTVYLYQSQCNLCLSCVLVDNRACKCWSEAGSEVNLPFVFWVNCWPSTLFSLPWRTDKLLCTRLVSRTVNFGSAGLGILQHWNATVVGCHWQLPVPSLWWGSSRWDKTC